MKPDTSTTIGKIYALFLVRKTREYAGGVEYVDPIPHIICNDGAKLSVQASENHYCSPRANKVEWYKFEVGFPNPPPTSELFKNLAEDASRPTETVYAYVPVQEIVDYIEEHGGVNEEWFAKTFEGLKKNGP